MGRGDKPGNPEFGNEVVCDSALAAAGMAAMAGNRAPNIGKTVLATAHQKAEASTRTAHPHERSVIGGKMRERCNHILGIIDDRLEEYDALYPPAGALAVSITTTVSAL